jgi:threonine/homoserine/homoserine lactone efflux protein
LDSLYAVALAGLALSITPGPSMLYVLSRTVGQSRAAGLASALGLCLGGMALAIATALGLATIFERFEWVEVTLRYIGSAYLVWLGVDMIRSAREQAKLNLTSFEVQRRPLSSIIWQGIVVELMNPKTVLFFALFLPPFVSSGGETADSNLQLQLLTLGVLVPLTAIPSDLVVAFMGGTLTKVLNEGNGTRVALAWSGGLILIGIALNLHLQLI